MVARKQSRFAFLCASVPLWFILLSGLMIIRPFAAVAGPEILFDGNRAFADLRTQCEFGPRPPGSEAHARCRDWITSACRSLDLETTHQTFFAYVPLIGKTVRLTNIIALHQPRNSRKLMLSAHWDTRPIADNESDPVRRRMPIVGANDGASGVAVLLELARLFRWQPPRVGVVFVFFDGEDVGTERSPYCLGSQYLADHLPESLRFEKGVNLDMVGDRDLNIPLESYSWRHAQPLALEIWKIGSQLYPEIFRAERGREVFDDHVAFVKRGIPYVNVIDFDYPYWHTLDDTEDKCSAASLESVGRVIARFVLSQ